MIAILRLLVRLLFRFRAYNTDALRAPGPVLLLPNHVSWWDWLLLGVCLEKDWRFVTSSTTANLSRLHRLVMVNRRTFPVENHSPYAVRHMAEYLQKGGRLVLFPEGRMSQTGSLMKLFTGTGFLIHKTRAKVVVGYLRGADRLKPAVHRGFTQWLPRVSAHFSGVLVAPDPGHVSAAVARARITQWLRERMTELQFAVEMEFGPRTVPEAVAKRVRERPGFRVLEDVTWTLLPYRRIALGAGLLAAQWRRRFGAPEPSAPPREPVGVLLPNVNALPVTLLSLWSANRVPAILNYSGGPAMLLACAQLAGLKHIITSRTFLARAKLGVEPLAAAGMRLHYLEDVRAEIGKGEKIAGLLRSRLCPARPLRSAARAEDTAVILFTSGSEGAPKGVALTHGNLLANIRQMCAVCDLSDTDRFFTALPLFHSFGMTVGALLPLIRGAYVFLYPSPLHYHVVPVVLYDKNATVFFATNTFLAGYARKAHPYDFRSLRYLFAGAEKLQEATVRVWNERFGVRVLEGYGATECSPCISVNVPLSPRPGSVGRLMPGMEARLEPVEGVDGGGRLFVRGPNVMRGYLNADADAKFKALGGWYDTGDVIRRDEDGFLHILGRLKRFAKVGGEMVSLTAVEEALAGAFPRYGLRFDSAVLAVPDADKGERLVAVSNEPHLTLDEVRAAIKARGFGNLAVPRELRLVREIPKLGSGKVNYRELDRLVRES